MTEPPAPPDRQERVLRRSREDRVLGGVCSGLGRYFGVDPVIVRLAFIVLTVAGGGGVIAYLIAWFVIPEQKEDEDLGPPPESRTDSLWLFFGIGLIGLGTILLIDRVVPWFDRIIGPIVLVGIGVALLLHGMQRR